MCVAAVVPDGVRFPDLDDLEAMEKMNSDGAGIAWFDEGEVHWLKGLSAIEVHTLGCQLSGPKLLHFRMATAGGDHPELSHPFPIERAVRTNLTGRAKKVLIHNGHIGDWEFFRRLMAPLPAGKWSDTRLVARMVHMVGKDILDEFPGQKFATLDNTGQAEMFGRFEMRAGVHYSNTMWEVFTNYFDRNDMYNEGPDGGYRNWWLTQGDRVDSGDPIDDHENFADWRKRAQRRKRHGQRYLPGWSTTK